MVFNTMSFRGIGYLSRDSGVIQLVEGVHNAPTDGGFLHTEIRTRMWRDTLADMASLAATLEKFINSDDLVAR